MRLQVLSCGLFFVGESRSFKATDSDPVLVKTLDAQCPVSSTIELKLGAQVRIKTMEFYLSLRRFFFPLQYCKIGFVFMGSYK